MAQLFQLPKAVAIDANLRLVSGAKAYFYQTLTNIPQNTYSDSGLSVPNSNPVVADAAGVFPPIWLDEGLIYGVTLKTSANVLIYTIDPIGDTLARDLADGSNVNLVNSAVIKYDRTAAEIAVSLTPVNYAYIERDLRRYSGVVADGTTDCTAAILAVANAMSGVFSVPYGVKYNRATLLASLDPDVVLFDLSSINDYSSSGDTNKHVGITSSDSAPNDTHWHINSGHHAVLDLNNFGSSGTTSATNRLMSIVYSAGELALGAANKRGYRGAAILQFANQGSFWAWGLRSLAPWQAIAANYENWAPGQVISGAGVYRASSVGHYDSTGAGTTGSTEPTHTSGTVSDGGVSWTYVDSIDRTLFYIDQYGRWLTNSGSGSNTFEHKARLDDPAGGAYFMRLAANGVSKNAILKLVPTNASNVETSVPYLQSDSAAGTQIMKSDGATSLAAFTDTGFQVKKIQLLSATAPNNSTTPSVAGVSTLYLTNSGSTSITGFTGSVDDDVVVLVATNGNTTLVHSSTLTLTGSTNIALTAWSSLTLKKVPVGISDRWVEIARSIK